MKALLKRFIPERGLRILRPVYHGILAVAASAYYGNPSGKMVVIGVTGTAGKSTTAAMLSHILNFGGKKSGYMTTVNFFDGDADYLNKHGLSMPGGPLIQRQLAQMAAHGCRYGIVECTSEGLAQNRHGGIRFSAALFTNLSEAHIQAHGSFDKYRAAKGKLFTNVQTIGVNRDDENAEYFLNFSAEKKFGVSFAGAATPPVPGGEIRTYQAKKTAGGFEMEGLEFAVKLPGEFNKYNALLAAAAANVLGVDLATVQKALESFTGIRGRMEPVENDLGIQVFVDYGCEPASFAAALNAANQLPHRRIIHVFGSTGGHRDVSKRFAFGRSSARLADTIYVTNDDVYDSDPAEIIQHIQEGIASVEAGERKAEEIHAIPDRRTAIAAALRAAQPGDLVLITGKGSEQFLVLPGNKRIEWDEVRVVREELKNRTL